MSSNTENNPQIFLNDVASAMDAAADRLDAANNGQHSGLTTTNYQNSRPKFMQKLVYSSCYSLSFGVCFPVYLACRYVPKNNPLVQGMIAGGTAATHDVDAWLARMKQARQSSTESAEEGQVATSGAMALSTP